MRPATWRSIEVSSECHGRPNPRGYDGRRLQSFAKSPGRFVFATAPTEHAAESLVDIIGRFMHLQVEEKTVGGKKIRKEAMIFPRYHQLVAVRTLEADAKAKGVGNNYLVQHSAGSGKSNSRWARPFYARHTFEVEFLKAGNANEVVSTLPTIYDQQARQVNSEGHLRNADIAVAGAEVLRLAAKQGKGWFALLLSESITPRTTVPDYVLEAVAFACASTFPKKTLRQMIEYRCERCHQDSPDKTRVLAAVHSATPNDLLSTYRELFPDDVISRFVTLLK